MRYSSLYVNTSIIMALKSFKHYFKHKWGIQVDLTCKSIFSWKSRFPAFDADCKTLYNIVEINGCSLYLCSSYKWHSWRVIFNKNYQSRPHYSLSLQCYVTRQTTAEKINKIDKRYKRYKKAPTPFSAEGNHKKLYRI